MFAWLDDDMDFFVWTVCIKCWERILYLISFFLSHSHFYNKTLMSHTNLGFGILGNLKLIAQILLPSKFLKLSLICFIFSLYNWFLRSIISVYELLMIVDEFLLKWSVFIISYSPFNLEIHIMQTVNFISIRFSLCCTPLPR